MSKTNTNLIYRCSTCDAQFTKWTGRCLECGSWGTVAETLNTPTASKMMLKKQGANTMPPTKTTLLSDVAGNEADRKKTGISELDRVLGGGLVNGSYILLGGEPGVGKSTLALQCAAIISNALYISGEESAQQVKLRSDRIGIKHTSTLQFANEVNVETIIATIKSTKPPVAIIDSIQTIYSLDTDGEPGSISQVRVCAAKLMEAAKSGNTAIIVIGHVTKEGSVAGPKTLEHLVDTVLYLEGDRNHQLRILRATKNRFGSTDEIGMFEMVGDGMVEVKNPSAALLEERGTPVSGSAVTCFIEGTRPLLVEIQALLTQTVFGYPVRKASGFDLNRLHVLIAVLQKRAGINLAQYDVHINVVGGIKVTEPAADLAVCMAIMSAYKDKPLGNELVAFGEVGLGGEIRSVNMLEKRLRECEQLGMKKIMTMIPKKISLTKTTLEVVHVTNVAAIQL